MGNVSMQYGPPEAGSDTAGDDPLFRQMVAYGEPVGEFAIDELCGPGKAAYSETYDLEIVVQVIARTRDAMFPEVEARRALIVWELTRVLQDPTLGFVDTDSGLFGNLEVSVSEFDGLSGWLVAGGSNLAATRATVQITVTADTKAETS